MCGIVGILAKAGEGDGGRAFRAAAGQARETAAALEGGRLSEAASRAEALDRLSRSAVSAGSVLHLLDQGADGLASLSAEMDRLTARAAVLAGKSSAEEAEAWNRTALRLRDARWRLAVDLAELTAWVRAFEEEAGPFSGTGRARLFHLAVMLRSLDRLEVRGRDSAGLATIFTFPDRASLDAFRATAAEALERRAAVPHLGHGAVVRCAGPPGRPCLVFAHKVAEEIGRLGQNVAALTAALRADRPFLALLDRPEVTARTLAHTRWASNGIINEENCHPVDSRAEGPWDEERPLVLAVLNGDIDNHLDLRAELAEAGAPVPAGITTDAKIIPLAVARAMEEGRPAAAALAEAAARFEGSFALAALCSTEPDRVLLAQRGSGQALYVGETDECFVFASEVYGLVEVADRCRKMEDAADRADGTVVELGADGRGWLEARGFSGRPLPPPPPAPAAITTRDIHRGAFEHFFLKEISEAPESFRKTLAGKFRIDKDGGAPRPVFTLPEETVPPFLWERFAEGRIRQVVFIGQGTASVAGMAVAELFASLFGPGRFHLAALKASEFSAFGLRSSMEDTVVVAVSQSGTTTDTNRTVDLARKRGAAVLAVVNRRQSDLADKADGVLYTADGRDVEMSVASTKAFYAQVGAGYLLGLYLAHRVGALDDEETARRLRVLGRVPDLLAQTLADADAIRRSAEEHALGRRHWAVVGSGLDKVSAEEVRIKLSELNYKSISCDVTEDKKHIDLSAEPLILVCAANLSEAHLADTVKEVSIFRAHRACPVVIAPEGERAFDACASAVLPVRSGAGELAFLLGTMVGHLWGYHAARAIDASAQCLRSARAAVVAALPELRKRTGFALAQTAGMLARQVEQIAQEFRQALWSGRYDASLEAATAGRLWSLFQYASGRVRLHNARSEFGIPPRWDALHGLFLTALSDGIGALTRPIDAIKHQAKTVTVGISREEVRFEGILFEKLLEAGIGPDAVDLANQAVIEFLSAAVERVEGHTVYGVSGLDENLRPDEETVIAVRGRAGVSASMSSRYDEPRPLRGTKARVLARGRVFVGTGRRDGRTIVIVPTVARDETDGSVPLALFHVAFRTDLPLEAKVRVLRNFYERYEEIRWAAGELAAGFEDAWLDPVPVRDLLVAHPDALAERIVRNAGEGDDP